MKKIVIIIFLALLLFSCTKNIEKNVVLASTAWTGAFVRTAGIENVKVLAPFELKHPPEYELKPSDILLVSKATHLVYAGYEKMVEKLKENSSPSAKLITITTRNDPQSIKAGVMKIAAEFGTEEKAKKNLERIAGFFKEWSVEIEKMTGENNKTICHVFQKPLAENVGFNVIGTFGPAPPEAKQILELVNLEANIIIDNYHNPVASPLSSSIPGSKTAVFINFPMNRGDQDLLNILKQNREKFSGLF